MIMCIPLIHRWPSNAADGVVSSEGIDKEDLWDHFNGEKQMALSKARNKGEKQSHCVIVISDPLIAREFAGTL